MVPQENACPAPAPMWHVRVTIVLPLSDPRILHPWLHASGGGPSIVGRPGWPHNSVPMAGSFIPPSCKPCAIPRFRNNPSLHLQTSGAWPRITSHLAHPTLTLRTGPSHWSHHLVPVLLLSRKLRLYLSHCGRNPAAGCLRTCTSARAGSHPTADPL